MDLDAVLDDLDTAGSVERLLQHPRTLELLTRPDPENAPLLAAIAAAPRPADPAVLEPVWRAQLASPRSACRAAAVAMAGAAAPASALQDPHWRVRTAALETRPAGPAGTRAALAALARGSQPEVAAALALLAEREPEAPPAADADACVGALSAAAPEAWRAAAVAAAPALVDAGDERVMRALGPLLPAAAVPKLYRRSRVSALAALGLDGAPFAEPVAAALLEDPLAPDAGRLLRALAGAEPSPRIVRAVAPFAAFRERRLPACEGADPAVLPPTPWTSAERRAAAEAVAGAGATNVAIVAELRREEHKHRPAFAHGVLWALLGLRFPQFAGDVLGDALPLTFALADRHEPELALPGLFALLHVVRNATPTELTFYAPLLLDVLGRVSTTREPAQLSLALAALDAVLAALGGRRGCAEQEAELRRALQNLSLARDHAVRAAFARHIEALVTQLGPSARLVRHLALAVPVLAAALDAADAPARAAVLRCVERLAQFAWPRMRAHRLPLACAVAKAMAVTSVERGCGSATARALANAEAAAAAAMAAVRLAGSSADGGDDTWFTEAMERVGEAVPSYADILSSSGVGESKGR